MRIDKILSKKPTLSFEFFPPKNEKGLENLKKTLIAIKKYKPDFISVTDSNVTAKTKHIALSKIIKKKFNYEILLHLTCINNTKNEITNVIKEIRRNRIENILALRGDRANFVSVSKDFKHATDLIKILSNYDFSIGIAAHPHGYSESIYKDIKYIKKNIELGASFMITQLFFDNTVFYRFREKLMKNKINSPVICGIMSPISPVIFQNILKKVKRIKIPSKLSSIIDKYRSNKEEFIKYTVEFTVNQCNDLIKNGINGLHFFTFNRPNIIRNILNSINTDYFKSN